MNEKGPILLADVKRLTDVEAPDLVQAILAIVQQGEGPAPDPMPDDLISLRQFRQALDLAARRTNKKERSAQAHEAWKRYLAQAESQLAPQISLADLIALLYDKRTGPARRALLLLIREAPLVFGIWGGIKRVYKRAEADLDVEIFAACAVRFDMAQSVYYGQDVKRGTLVYLSRRVWRFLRQLGKAVPELYPSFATETMRSYPIGAQMYNASIATKIMHHTAPKWGAPKGLAKDKKFRAPYLDAWKRSPDPLMLMLETCQSDMAASFAILGLRELFPDALRKVTPEWLGRLAFRPLSSAHDFLVETLEASPELHQGKLKSLGLHEPVLALLVSPSAKARKYAIEYARGHAADMAIERLVDLLEKSESAFPDTAKFVGAIVTARNAREIGIAMLGRLVAFTTTNKWATTALEGEFDKKELSDGFFLDMLFAKDAARPSWAKAFLDKKAGDLPMAFFLRVLDDPRIAEQGVRDVASWAMKRLAKLEVGDAPGEWILGAIVREDIASDVGAWLSKATRLPKGLDLERIKGLVFDPNRREVAFTLLGNRKLVSPGEVGLGWLLALARRADPKLHEWAHRYLLQHMRPEHFAEGKENAEKGIARLFALALGAKEPEAVRVFAQTYLRCHHPAIGPEQTESKQFGVKPLIPREAYTEARIWPALFDTRGDVRRFAVTLTRIELRRWGAQPRIYELAEASAKEVRKIAYDALSQAGEPHAEPDLALLPEELDAAQIFSMTESRQRASRDVAIELIRKHYARIGGIERLGWLMQSADREVRFFAVRLLWEKHRPRGLPSTWKPAKGAIENAGPFKDAEALRDLLRRLLFTIPPTRSAEALDEARAKKLPASVAKRNLVDIVRDLAVEDATFAALVAPVLGEHTGSIAKGEWHACLSALMTLSSVHGIKIEGLL